MLFASGQGVRHDLWSYQAGLALMRAMKWVGLAAAALAVAGFVAGKGKRLALLALALVIGLAVSAVPFNFEWRARSVPRMHDVTTDPGNPPQFAAVSPRPAPYGGAEVAALQQNGYPDIRPLVLAVPPQVAFARAKDAAEGMGWALVVADPAAGHLEATARTFWFGFRDDVAVRIAPEGTGSRVDVRSVSRVGRSDLGTNARRVREYLDRVRNY